MKKIGISFIVFLITFLIGCFVAFPLFDQTPEIEPVSFEKVPPAADPIPKNADIEANPEFIDLADFGEFGLEPPENNLIDLRETNGIFRESEVVARNGQQWLTLFEQDGNYLLINSKAEVKLLNTASFTGDENDAQLRLKATGTPIFATRKISRIKPGPVTTLYLHPTSDELDRQELYLEPMKAGYRREFELNGQTFLLRVSTGLTKRKDKVAVLVLEHDGKSQVIDYNYDLIGDLLWAGDLDNDGKLDLYTNEFNEKGYFQSKLFLSSSATKGKLLKLVGTFGMAGC